MAQAFPPLLWCLPKLLAALILHLEAITFCCCSIFFSQYPDFATFCLVLCSGQVQVMSAKTKSEKEVFFLL
jgi:hypothetical protein